MYSNEKDRKIDKNVCSLSHNIRAEKQTKRKQKDMENVTSKYGEIVLSLGWVGRCRWVSDEEVEWVFALRAPSHSSRSRSPVMFL